MSKTYSHMSRKNFPFLIVCSLIIVGLMATIFIVISQKKEEAQKQLQKSFPLTLKIGESKFFPDKTTKVILQQIVLAPSDQKDGLTQVQLLIDKNGKSEELVYKIGGFVGFDIRELSYSAGKIKLIDIKENQVKLDVVLNE